MTIAEEYKRERSKLKRSYGRYKKYGIEKRLPENKAFPKLVKKPTRSSIERLKKAQVKVVVEGRKSNEIYKRYLIEKEALQRIRDKVKQSGTNYLVKNGEVKAVEQRYSNNLSKLKRRYGITDEEHRILSDEYHSERSRLKRIYGQYKKYGIEYVKDFEELVPKEPKRITKSSINALRKAENKIKAAGEKAQREQDAEIIIDNLLYQMQSYAVGLNDWTSQAMEKSEAVLADIVERAIQQNGMYETAQAIKSYSGSFNDMIKRLIRAIYDPEFKNNLAYTGKKGNWKNYKQGANAYIRTVTEFASRLGVEPSQTLLAAMGGNM